MIALAIAVIIGMTTKRLPLGLLFGYLFLVISSTLLTRIPTNGVHFQPELFWSYKVWDSQKEQILANIVMFIPIGLLLFPYLKWKTIPVSTAFSSLIEVLQLLNKRGLCEFDDMINNTMGAMIGIGLYYMGKWIYSKLH